MMAGLLSLRLTKLSEGLCDLSESKAHRTNCRGVGQSADARRKTEPPTELPRSVRGGPSTGMDSKGPSVGPLKSSVCRNTFRFSSPTSGGLPLRAGQIPLSDIVDWVYIYYLLD
jgi:hypothetical protein